MFYIHGNMKRTTGKQMSLPSWQIKERLFPRTCARSPRLFSPSLYCPGGSSSHRVPATWRLQLSPSPCHLEAPVLTSPGGSGSAANDTGARYGVRADAWLARGSSGAWLSSHACITGTVPCLDCLYRSSGSALGSVRGTRVRAR